MLKICLVAYYFRLACPSPERPDLTVTDNAGRERQPSHRSFAALRDPGFRPYFLYSALAMMADSVEHVISYWVVFQKFHSPALGGYAVLAGSETGVARLMELLPPARVGERLYPLRLALHGPYHTPLVSHVARAAHAARP